MKILIATNNKHKINEILSILEEKIPGQIQLVRPRDLGINLNVEENTNSLEGNAELKARAFFNAAKIPVIADDTGLEIDALNGQPGVISARFAGEPSNDERNRKKVLELMRKIPEKERTARFRTVICYIDEKTTNFIQGKCEGKIINEERGNAGFGYDPIFMPDGSNKTFAEMTAEEKNAVSHRGNAIKNFADWLSDRLYQFYSNAFNTR